MKTFIILIISTILLNATSSAEELIKIEALGGKVTIQAPKGFGPMPNELLEIKYPHSRRPTEVLSDETGGVTLAFNHTNNAMTPSQVKAAHLSMSEMFHNTYPSATWKRDEVIEQNGKAFMVFEMITPAIDTKIHNIMYGTSVDDRFLLVAFNTTIEQSKKWLPIGKKIMESLTVLSEAAVKAPSGTEQSAKSKLPHGYPDRKPGTVEEAIDILNAVLTDKQKKEIASKTEDEMIEYHFSLGMWIRNNFGLWGSDSKLLTALGKGHPDDASGVLINKYWHSLQATK